MSKNSDFTDPNDVDLSRGQDDHLMSIAVIARGDICEVINTVRASITFLQDRFEFFELIIFVGILDYEKNKDAYSELLDLRNVRTIVLREGTGDYRTAIVAVTETIGDFVCVLQADEFALVNLTEICDAVIASGGSVALRLRRGSGFFARVLSKILSITSGYDVDPMLLRSAAYSRTHIGRIASRSDREVALRFKPRGSQRPSELTVLTVLKEGARRPKSSLWRRVGHALDVLGNSPPVLFRHFATWSFLVGFGATSYALYALVLYLFGVELQPGWLTTSLAISGSTAFFSLAFGGLFTGVYQILNLLRDDYGSEIIKDVSTTDLFHEFRRINVETVDVE